MNAGQQIFARFARVFLEPGSPARRAACLPFVAPARIHIAVARTKHSFKPFLKRAKTFAERSIFAFRKFKQILDVCAGAAARNVAAAARERGLGETALHERTPAFADAPHASALLAASTAPRVFARPKIV